MRFGPGLRLDTPSPPRKYRRIVLRDRPIVRDRPRMLPPCFFKTTNSICSSDFSIGSSLTEKPPKAMGQIHHAGWVSFPLPVTARFAAVTELDETCLRGYFGTGTD